MNLPSIYKNRSYAYEPNKDVFSPNTSVITAICQHIGLKNPSNIEFVATNYNCDIYKVLVGQEWFCVKYSFDSDSNYLSKEIDVLRLLGTPNIPQPIAAGTIKFGDNIGYSVSTFECAENLQEAGASHLLSACDSFFQSFALLGDNCVDGLPSLTEHIETAFSKSSLDHFPDTSKQAVDEQIGLSLIAKASAKLCDELLQMAENPILNTKEFCHGNLKPSNVLFKFGQFKFVNFHSCHQGNRALDIAHLLAFGIPDKSLKQHLIGRSIQEYPRLDLRGFALCNKFIFRKLFFDLLMSYLQEVYVFESFRPIELVSIADVFARNSQSFQSIDCIRPYYDMAFSAISTPIIGSA